MRKKAWLALFLAVLLTGCGSSRRTGAEQPADTYPPPAPAASPAAEAVADTAGADENIVAAQMAEAARPLTEEEILKAYDKAVTAYGWFDLSPLPTVGEAVETDGALYRRVEARGMEDLEDLQFYLRGIFSEAVAQRLLDAGGEHPLYRNIDGVLYGRGTGREKDPQKGTVQIRTEQTDAAAYAVNVMVDLLAEDGVTVTGVESWSFPYVFEAGHWVFAEFKLVY